jgi:hypothetical protein
MWTEQLASGRWRAGYRVPGSAHKIQVTFDREDDGRDWATARETKARASHEREVTRIVAIALADAIADADARREEQSS